MRKNRISATTLWVFMATLLSGCITTDLDNVTLEDNQLKQVKTILSDYAIEEVAIYEWRINNGHSDWYKKMTGTARNLEITNHSIIFKGYYYNKNRLYKYAHNPGDRLIFYFR